VRENASKLAFDKGCRVTFTANVNTPSNRKMVLLQRYPGSFHTKKLCSGLYSTEHEIYSQKKTNSLFEPPFGGVRGNAC